MATVARDIVIEYGAVTVGGTVGSSFVSIHDIHTLSRDDSTFDLSATLLVTAATAGSLASGCSDLEDAFTARRKDLKVTIGGSTFVEFKHTTNTALNIRSTISKSGSQADSSLSRLYEISITGDTSPDNPPQTSSFSATYGTQAIPGTVSTAGGTATLSLQNIHSVFRDESRFEVSLSVLVKASSASILGGACTDLEETFTARRKDFVAKMGSTDIAVFKHSDNTGLDIRSSINKAGSTKDSELTRLYTITISGVTTQATPPQTPDLSITYGSVTIGGTLSGATLSLYDVHSISRDQDNFSLTASVLVRAPDAATLSTSCADLEQSFTTRRLDLSVTMGGNTILELKQSDNSALNTTSSIEKQGSPIDSELSRLYVVTVSGEVPTPTAVLNALRSFNYDIAFSASRIKTLTVSGTYTAVVGTAASAQYIASINARVSLITTALGGTWELLNEVYTPDDTDQVVNFSNTYRELIYGNATTLYSAGIRNQTLSVKTDKLGSSGLKDERKLIVAVATYSASISSTVTKDIDGLWKNTIRPYMIKEIRKVLGTKVFAVISQSADYDRVENRLDAVIEARGRSESDTISHTVSATDDIDMGVIIARTWPTQIPEKIRSGTRAYVYQGPKSITRTISETMTKVGNPNMSSPNGIHGDRTTGVDGIKAGEAVDQVESLLVNVSNGILTKYTETQTPRSMGIKGNAFGLVDINKTWVYEFFDVSSSRTRPRVSTPEPPRGPRGS